MNWIPYVALGVLICLTWFFRTTDRLIDQLVDEVEGGAYALDEQRKVDLSLGRAAVYLLKNILFLPFAFFLVRFIWRFNRNGYWNEKRLRRMALFFKTLTGLLLALLAFVLIRDEIIKAPIRAERERERAAKEAEAEREAARLLDPANFFVTPQFDPALPFDEETLRMGDVFFALPVPRGYSVTLVRERPEAGFAWFKLANPDGDGFFVYFSGVRGPPIRHDYADTAKRYYARQSDYMRTGIAYDFARRLGYDPHIARWDRDDAAKSAAHFASQRLGGVFKDQAIAQNTANSFAVVHNCVVEMEDGGPPLALWLLLGEFANDDAFGTVCIGLDMGDPRASQKLALTWFARFVGSSAAK